MTELTGLFIAHEKLVDYLLNLDHPDGGSKARFFIARGFARERPEQLAQALTEHATSGRAAGTIGHLADDRLERRLSLVGPISCPDGTEAVIKSIWAYREGGETARFITAYPSRRRALN